MPSIVSECITCTNTCKLVPIVWSCTWQSFEFTVTSTIQDFHVYKQFGKSQRKVGNPHNPVAVAVIKSIDGEECNCRAHFSKNICHL